MTEELDFDAQMAETEPVATPENPPAEPEVASTESQPKYAALDAVLPDSDDVDEDFRGKPLADIIRVAKQHKQEAKKAYEVGSRYNDLESKYRVAEALLNELRQRNQQPQTPPPSPDELVQRFAQNPPEFLNQYVQQATAPLYQELQMLRAQTLEQRAESAREAARTAVGIKDREAWYELRRPLAMFLSANNADPTDPRAWQEAFDAYKASASRVAAPVEIPKAAPPPTGQARSTVREVTRPRLSERDRRNLADLADSFGIKPGTKAFEELESRIAAGGDD